MKQELTDEVKQKIIDELNQPEEASGEGNAQVINAKDSGIFDQAAARGDVRGQVAHFTAINVSARAKADALFDGAKLSSHNIKKAVLAACAIPDGESDIKFGGTEQQKEAAKALFYYLQTAIMTRGIALERATKLELMEKQQAAAAQEAKDDASTK